jgi:coenzyme F420-dependent glucose-6-phosphate dehydrogenase
VTLCWANSEAAARRTALEWWPTAAIHGDSSQELPLPSSFEGLAKSLTEDDIAQAMSCGPDAEVHLAAIQPYVDAGFSHIYLHQVGPDQAGFLEFARGELLPKLGVGRRSSRSKAA